MTRYPLTRSFHNQPVASPGPGGESFRDRRWSPLLPAFVAAVLAGCATMPESTPPLEEARAAHERARANPDVLRHANDIMDRATATLEEAEAADDVDEMNDLAYIANAEVQTAEAVASRQAAEARVQELSRVKQRVQLEVREAEAAAARSRADTSEQALEQSREALEESREQLRALQAKQTERGTVVTLGNVLFETGKSQLLPGAMNSLNRLADYLKNNEKATVLIEGHTDSTGSDELNMRLSRARAESVRSELVTRDIDSSRITVAGLGSSQPVASNSTAAGRQQNRRVEIIIR